MRASAKGRQLLLQDGDIDDIARPFPGWLLEAIQLSRGPVSCSGVLLPLGSVRAAILQVSSATVLRGASARNDLSLLSTPATSPPMRAGTRPICLGTCLTFRGKTPVDIFLPPSCRMFVVSMPMAVVQAEALSSGMDSASMQGRVELRALSTDHTALLSRSADLLEDLLRAREPIGPQVRQRLCDLLVPAAASLFLHSTLLQPESAQKGVRRAAVGRACAYIDEHLRESITLTDLCAFAGVRARTLEYGFREFYDVGPMTYLRSVRLCRVRLDLLASRQVAGAVAKVARRWHFTHMGQFSRDYRLLFGESPSATLAPRARTTGPPVSRENSAAT
jgi:AraC family transcriptional regulator, ethanolamine operon transcriptional activator